MKTTFVFCFTLFNSDPKLFSAMNMSDSFAQFPWSHDNKALPYVLVETICSDQIFPVVFIRCLHPVGCFANCDSLKSGGGVSLNKSTQDN